MLSKKQPYCRNSTIAVRDKVTYIDEKMRNIIRHDVIVKQIIEAVKANPKGKSTKLFNGSEKTASLAYVANFLEIAMGNLLNAKKLWPLKFKFHPLISEGQSALFLCHDIHTEGFADVIASLHDELVHVFSKLWETHFIETSYDSLFPTERGAVLYDSSATSMALHVTEEQLCNIVIYVKEDGKEHICLRANSDLSNLYTR